MSKRRVRRVGGRWELVPSASATGRRIPKQRPASESRPLSEWKPGEHAWETIGMIGSQSYECVLCRFSWNVFESETVKIPQVCEGTSRPPECTFWHEWAKEWRVPRGADKSRD